MHKKIRWMDWELNVDLENTKKWYNTHHNICHCDNCQYYMDYMGNLRHNDIPIMEMFNTFAIDPTMPFFLEEIFEKDIMDKGLRQYYGCYCIVGELIEGEYCPDIEEHEENTVKINNFIIGFEEMFVHVEYFPYPLLQLEFKAVIPYK